MSAAGATTAPATGEGASPSGTTPRRRTSRIIIILALLLIAAILVKAFLFQSFSIPSASMTPSLMPGDRVLVYRQAYANELPSRGDIIVFSDPHESVQGSPGVAGALGKMGEELGVGGGDVSDYVKRVIGLPGETVQARSGEVLIDGVPIPEPYLLGESTADFGPFVVPEGALFVLGDARPQSDDSRFSLGPVPIDRVVGEVAVRFWPPSRAGGV